MALDALGHLFHKFESQPQWRSQRQFRQVLDAWPQVVGASVLPQTQPVRIAQEVLFVAVASPTWGQTLTFERLRILEKLNATVSPPLKDIRFSTGDWFRRGQANRDRTTPDEAALRSHPSFSTFPAQPESSASTPPQTAVEAFQQWAQRHQQATRQQVLCPRCTCPAPAGELKRWGVCSLCAAKS
ncbi:MAG TPA: DUF721 domain-containing protein, partial [Trichocoleus sp.]